MLSSELTLVTVRAARVEIMLAKLPVSKVKCIDGGSLM
jgi:hypothetical protein